jgi:tetratricopeptide (TPR) repeat protein
LSWEESVKRGALALAQSDYDKAAQAFESALEAASVLFAHNDWRLGQTLSFLGQTYFRAGIYGSAVEYLNRSTRLADGADPVRLAGDHLSLAYISQSKGLTNKANEHVGQAIKGLKNYRSDSVEVCALIDLLRYAEQKENEKSQTGFRQLLANAQLNYSTKESQQTYFGTEPDDAVETWERLMTQGAQGALSGSQESLIEAYKNLNSAARIASSTFNQDHANIAESLTALAIVSAQLGLSDDAEELFFKAAEIYDRPDGDHAKLAILNLHMAKFYSDLCDHSLAIDSLSEAAQLLQSTSEMPDVTNSFFDLLQKANIHQRCREFLQKAIELEEVNDLQQASVLYDNCLALTENLLGSGNLEFTQILRFKANLLEKLNSLNESHFLASRADEIENELVARALEIERLKAHLPALKRVTS